MRKGIKNAIKILCFAAVSASVYSVGNYIGYYQALRKYNITENDGESYYKTKYDESSENIEDEAEGETEPETRSEIPDIAISPAEHEGEALSPLVETESLKPDSDGSGVSFTESGKPEIEKLMEEFHIDAKLDELTLVLLSVITAEDGFNEGHITCEKEDFYDKLAFLNGEASKLSHSDTFDVALREINIYSPFLISYKTKDDKFYFDIQKKDDTGMNMVRTDLAKYLKISVTTVGNIIKWANIKSAGKISSSKYLNLDTFSFEEVAEAYLRREAVKAAGQPVGAKEKVPAVIEPVVNDKPDEPVPVQETVEKEIFEDSPESASFYACKDFYEKCCTERHESGVIEADTMQVTKSALWRAAKAWLEKHYGGGLNQKEFIKNLEMAGVNTETVEHKGLTYYKDFTLEPETIEQYKDKFPSYLTYSPDENKVDSLNEKSPEKIPEGVKEIISYEDLNTSLYAEHGFYPKPEAFNAIVKEQGVEPEHIDEKGTTYWNKKVILDTLSLYYGNFDFSNDRYVFMSDASKSIVNTSGKPISSSVVSRIVNKYGLVPMRTAKNGMGYNIPQYSFETIKRCYAAEQNAKLNKIKNQFKER